MSVRVPDTDVVRMAVALACRAPSVHNSQPWRWTYGTTALDLCSDASRAVRSADPSGRQLVISCGAALHHLRVAFTALKWSTDVLTLPEGGRSERLATVRFGHDARPASHDFDLVSAIRRRSSDRRPFAPVDDPVVERIVAATAAVSPATVTALDVPARSVLAEATEQSAAQRRYDSAYHEELSWWTGHSTGATGVPAEALATAEQRDRVDVGRRFPAGTRGGAGAHPPTTDRSTVVLISTSDDDTASWLAAGEALSALLLEATVHRFATCPLTHVTEVARSRSTVAGLVPDGGYPQALVRIGATPDEGRPKPTPRLPTDAVLTVAQVISRDPNRFPRR